MSGSAPLKITWFAFSGMGWSKCSGVLLGRWQVIQVPIAPGVSLPLKISLPRFSFAVKFGKSIKISFVISIPLSYFVLYEYIDLTNWDNAFEILVLVIWLLPKALIKRGS